MTSTITDITDTACAQDCCAADHEATCPAMWQCEHHKIDHDTARARALPHP